MTASICRCVVFFLAAGCLADVSPLAKSCGELACEQSKSHEDVSIELMNAADVSVELLQRQASGYIDEVADDEGEELDEEDIDEALDDEAEDFDEYANEDESEQEVDEGNCKSKCQRQYNKFVKKGKEGLGFKRVCDKSFCADCSFCEGEFPTPAPTAPCQQSCQARYEKLVKRGKESVFKDKVCKKYKCSGCDLCAEAPAPSPDDAAEAPAPAPAPEEPDEASSPAPDDADEAPAPAPEEPDEAPSPAPQDEAAKGPAPAPAKSLMFTKVEDNRYWGCPRKGIGSQHGFGHRTAQDCFAATLKDPACKDQFDYNQRYNGQCKCVVVGGCTALRGLGGYTAYKIQEVPKFSKVLDNRYWGCARKGIGNTHGFGHRTVQDCFLATLKDQACKGQFDYNQRYNGQCKCVTAQGCTSLKGLGGYIAYKIDDE